MNKLQTSNGRIILHAPAQHQWHEAGQNLPAIPGFAKLVGSRQETVHVPRQQPQTEYQRLSQLIMAGRQLHAVCREGYVSRLSNGEWRTCALAAAYAAAFGPAAVQRMDFSITECVWKLNMFLGYDMSKEQIADPFGRTTTVQQGSIDLVDRKSWSRQGVAMWLWKEGY